MNYKYFNKVIFVKVKLLLVVFFVFGCFIEVQAEEIPEDYNQQNIQIIEEAVKEAFKGYLEGEVHKKVINTVVAKSLFLVRAELLKRGAPAASVSISKIAQAFRNVSFLKKGKKAPTGIDLLVLALDVTKDFSVNLLVTQNPYFREDSTEYFRNSKTVKWLIDIIYLDVKTILLAKIKPISAAREAVVGNAYILYDIGTNVYEQAIIAGEAVSGAEYSKTYGQILNLENKYTRLVTKESRAFQKEVYLEEFESECLKFSSRLSTFNLFHPFGDDEVASKVETSCSRRLNVIKNFDANKALNYEVSVRMGKFDSIAANRYLQLYIPENEHQVFKAYCLIWCSNSPFLDVDKKHKYYESIKWAYENGLANGFQNTLEFRPSEFASVGQALLIASRYLGRVIPNNNSNLLEVYRTYLKDELGLSLPNSIDSLINDRPISRKEYAQIIYAIIAKKNPKALIDILGTNTLFTDISGQSLEEISTINSILKRGIMDYSGGYKLFQPDNSIRRGEMTDAIHKLSKYLKSVHSLRNSNVYDRGF